MPNFDLPVSDTSLGYSMATQFSAFGTSDPGGSIGNWLREDLNQAVVQYVTNGAATDLYPRRVYARSNGKVLAVIQCTENNRSAISLWGNWQAGEVMSGVGVRNSHIEDAALAFVQEMQQQGYLSNDILLVGHSQGGAIVHAMLRNIFLRRDVQRVRAITFGAPKTAGSSGYAGITDDRLCRWMTPDDPVPLLPPQSIPAAVLGGLGDPRAARRMTFFVQPAGGRLIASNPPVATPGVIPPTATLPAIANFAGWLAGVEQSSVPHRIATYSSYLAAYNARYPRPNQQRPSGGRQEPVNPTPSREVNRQQREFVQNVFLAGHEQNAVPARAPKPVLFYAQRTGRIWSVYLNGQAVAVGPTKKRARGLARLGNGLLRRLQRQAFVDPANLLAQIGSVIEMMSDPAGDFRPSLRTSLPGQGQ